jgi:hypothetical protein
MNKETYEALKRIIAKLGKMFDEKEDIENEFEARDLNQVESWVEEVAKDYYEEFPTRAVDITCNSCGEKEKYLIDL